MVNKLRFQMTAEDQAAVEQHLAALEELIKPHVTTLSPHDRKYLSRATDTRMRTLVRGLEHLEQNVQLSMAYAPVDEIRRDYDGKIGLNGCFASRPSSHR